MRKNRAVLSLLALTALAAHSAQARVPRATQKILGAIPVTNALVSPCASGEIIAIYDSKTSVARAQSHVRSMGYESKHYFPLSTRAGASTAHVVSVPKGSEFEAIAEFQNSGVSAQCNFIYRAQTTTPNDPNFSSQWDLHNTGQTISGTYYDSIDSTNNPGVSGDDMGLTSAWDRITDCSSVIVAVVDTGINYNHEDLSANMWNGGSSYPNHGYDFVGSTNDPMDKNGHGTHVAGTIGAVGNNGKGGTGVCWKAQLMAVRVLDSTGSGTTATIAQGINFAVAHGAKVINLSLGGSSDDTLMSSAITAAASQAVVVAAAGNSGTNNDSVGNAVYPCNEGESNLLCVAALDQSYNLASFSNYGPTSVHVGAPGVNIISTWAGSETALTDTFNTSGTLNWSNTKSGSSNGWGYQSISLLSGGTLKTYNSMTNPTNWDGMSKQYANNANDSVYKTFAFGSFDTLTLDFFAFYDTESGKDFFSVYSGSANSNPTSGGTQLDTMSGSTSGSATELTYDISSCIGTSCALGYLFTSDSVNTSYGACVLDFSVTGLSVATTGIYNMLEGTSMAAPHVSGLAAMLFAHNPSYSVSDVITAIKSGGTANANLAGKTSTGNSASAIGSLNYVGTPSSVSTTLLN